MVTFACNSGRTYPKLLELVSSYENRWEPMKATDSNRLQYVAEILENNLRIVLIRLPCVVSTASLHFSIDQNKVGTALTDWHWFGECVAILCPDGFSRSSIFKS